MDESGFAAKIERFAQSSGGGYRLYLIDPDFANKLKRATLGFGPRADFARATAGTLREFLSGIMACRVGHPDNPLCLTCDIEFCRIRLPIVVTFAVPLVNCPDEVMVGGVCRKCAAGAGWPRAAWEDQLAKRLRPVYVKVFGDDGLRMLDPGQVAGGADVDLVNAGLVPAGRA